MNEKRLQAYQNLIQALLTCPEGEEWDFLQANTDLIDGGFIQTIKQVMVEKQKLREKKRADFLRDILSELVSFQAYIELIEQLLNGENQEAIESLLNNHRHLLDGGLIQSMLAVANDILPRGNQIMLIY
ncbi:hypothetical protein RintRC_0813 [Richelia intracellularis]|nr:hypothetical protein RintRC_0813 [Richelia intracellularis]